MTVVFLKCASIWLICVFKVGLHKDLSVHRFSNETNVAIYSTSKVILVHATRIASSKRENMAHV